MSVNPVNSDGTIGAPMQVIPTARNAHAIITDQTNRFVFVPHLGTDQVFQFRSTKEWPPDGEHAARAAAQGQHRAAPPGRLARQPFRLPAERAHGDGHNAVAGKRKGILTEVSSASALPPESKLGPGMPRPQPGRDVSNDIWASDIHVTPDGRFLYAAERTSSSIGAFSADTASGKLAYLGSTTTEKQPRGFPHRSDRALHGRLRRELGDDLKLCDRAERDATPHRQGADRQRVELGRDRGC